MLQLTTLVMALSTVAGQAIPNPTPVYPKLQPLECFIGTWQAQSTMPSGVTNSAKLGTVSGKKVVLTISVRWAPGKCAQIVDTDYLMVGTERILGTSIRAWDQQTNTICERQFTTHKGTWTGNWTKSGDKWIYSYTGMNLDGRKCAGKRIFEFDGKDRYVSTDVDQTVAGIAQPDVKWEFTRK